METLALIPAKAGYSVTPSPENLRAVMDGPAGRIRRGVTGASWMLNVQFVTDEEGFRYLRAFYRTTLDNGALAFIVKLVFPLSTVTKHKAYFVPGSMKLTGIQGTAHVVTAQIEAEQRQRA